MGGWAGGGGLAGGFVSPVAAAFSAAKRVLVHPDARNEDWRAVA